MENKSYVTANLHTMQIITKNDMSQLAENGIHFGLKRPSDKNICVSHK